jgi:hypothetical protein
LGECAVDPAMHKPMKRPRRAFPTVIARRFVLEGRNYLTRGNAYYWAYRGVRWSFTPKSSSSAASAKRPVPANVKIVLNPPAVGTDETPIARPKS